MKAELMITNPHVELVTSTTTPPSLHNMSINIWIKVGCFS